MKVLVMCEESQRVCKEFRALGHEAYSTDLQDCSGGHPEWHLKMDCFLAFDLIKPELVIAHPPCTYLSNAGATSLFQNKILNQERYKKGLEAKNFFLKFFELPINKIAIENPVPMKIYNLPKSSQCIQPFQFGEPYTKKTYLWLIGLPPLIPTDILVGDKIIPWVDSSGRKCKDGTIHKGIAHSAKDRSKTFIGIAKAMAQQLGGLCE